MKASLNVQDFIFMSQRQRVSPFPNYFSMETMCDEIKQFTGERLDEVLNFWQGNVMFAFPHRRSYQLAGQALTEKIIKNQKFPAKLVTKQKQFGQALVDFAYKAHQAVGSKTTNTKLAQLFAEYEKRYRPVYSTYGWIWLVEDFFSARLLDLVEQKLKKDRTKAADVLNILTREPLALVAMLERKALIELALKIQKNKTSLADQKVQLLITKHVKDYFWVTRDYEDPAITPADVVRRLAELLKNDVYRDYQQQVKTLEEAEALQKKYLTEIDFRPGEKLQFRAMRDIAYLKELRKAYVSQSLFYFDAVLEEIGKRLFLSIRQVRFMKTGEVQQALIRARDFTSELNNRLKLSVWYTTKKGTEVITGKTAEKIFNQFCQVDKNTKEFKGLPVSPGRAIGRVKIIMNPNEVDKVKEGEIIVTVQVVPSFSTAIIKAAGLVCDGGHGITSHPATLAREAGIPCVVQTRFAREVLKDGDLVEVDGYKGVVKKIKE